MGWVCPQVDTLAFMHQCKAPLAAGKWNAWRLIRTNRDDPEKERVLAGAKRVVGQWLQWIDPDHPVAWVGTNFDHLEVSLDKPDAGRKYTLLADAGDSTRMKCPERITVAEVAGKGPLPEAWVIFFYRGQTPAMPWPAFKVNEFGISDWCPVDADWALWQVYSWENQPAPPPPPSVLPDIPMPQILNPTQSLTGVIFWGGVGVMSAWIVANRLFGK